MTMKLLFELSLCGYAAALLFSMVYLFARRNYLDWTANVLLGISHMMQSAYIVWRWIQAGRPPFSNMFESLVLFAWAIVLIYFLLRLRFKIPTLAPAASLMAALVLAYASSFKSDIEPLLPALRNSWWLTVHVFTCFLGYAGFAISFKAAIHYLIIRRRTGPDSRQAIADIETVMSKTVAFGFIFLTIGIITGSVWANTAWGRYWQWDPKETWSLITWFVYAGFLHCRYMRGWSGPAAAWMSIVGFVFVLITFLGVNLLRVFSGLHSYA